MKTETSPEFAERYQRWVKRFENLAETYREVRLHGPANDAEAWKGVNLMLAEAMTALARKSSSAN